MNTNYKVVFVLCAIILSVALVSGLWLHSWQNGQNRLATTITVTGSAKKEVVSDIAKWTSSFTKRAGRDNLKEMLEAANDDESKIRQFIKSYGLTDEDITFIPLQTDVVYEYLSNYGYTQNISGYNIRQEVRVENSDIDKIEKLANEAEKLIDYNIVPEYQRTEYFYSKLNELRPQLFAEATKDAKIRADAIAAGTGVKVGQLTAARTGVIQVLPPNSVDITDYGQYDLSTKRKEVSATVSVSFELLQ